MQCSEKITDELFECGHFLPKLAMEDCGINRIFYILARSLLPLIHILKKRSPSSNKMYQTSSKW